MATTVRAHVANGIGRLVLDAPPLNILTRAVLAEVRDQLAGLADDPSLRVLMFTAEGRHFSAGADVSEHLPPDDDELIPEFLATVAALDAFPLPTVAAVRGRCLGAGFELVQAADLVVAGESASFGQPEIRLGVVPPAACVLLPHLTTRGVAAEIAFTGDALDAREAERAGLVRRVVPDAELEAGALDLAGRIARHSGAALRIAKRALRSGDAPVRAAALATAGSLYLDELMSTADAMEGLTAFLEKRPPSWSHR